MARLQGGGVTEHPNVKVYIDLIIEELGSIDTEYPQTSDLFAAFQTPPRLVKLRLC